MVVIALTKIEPVALRSIEVNDRFEAYDLYSLNPNYIIAFVDDWEVTILGGKTQKESLYEILQKHGYIFKGRKVRYMCDEPI